MNIKFEYDYDQEKNTKLKKERDVDFEDVITALNGGKLLQLEKHHNTKYSHQFILTIEINNYAYEVPATIWGTKIKLISVWPSRRATKKYLGDTHECSKEEKSEIRCF